MRLKLTLITLLCAISMQAQTYTISGRTVDGKSQPVDMAAVRLMKGDSTFVSGQSTDSAGVFQFELKEAGEYILQFSFIGFNTQYRHVSLTAKKPHVSLGDIKLSTNDRLLSEATVTGHAAQVAIKEDTFVYNASAYRTPEGSTLEALVEKLPGAEVGDDGSIKINGKTVTQILVDGKDFFKGDTKVAMKNLPVDMVDKLKSYDKQSDYAKQTGIDDGNEETVLDVNMKQKLKSSWISNIDLAAGNHDRYSSNLFLNRFTDNTRITAFGSLNNTHDQRFRGGGPGFRGGGGGGLTASKMAGIDGFWNNGLNEDSAHYFEIGGNIRLSHSNSDHLTRSNSETFLSSSTASSFANSASHTYSKSSNINLEMNLSWKPDSMTWFRFRPSYSHTSSNSDGSSRSVTFNSDPYDIDGMTNPLDSMFQVNIPTSLTDIAVNRNNRLSLSDSKSDNWQGEFNLTRRLNRKGRSLSLRGQAGYTHSSSHSFSLSDIYYYQTTRTNGAHESYNNQYSLAPSTSWNYSARFSYSEPLFSHWFFQGSYEYEHKYSDRDRSLYQLDSLRDWGVGTNLITAKDNPSFGGVYKLAAIQDDNGNFIPKIKLSENTEKVTNPGNKKIYRVYNEPEHKIQADIICLEEETFSENEKLTIFDPVEPWKKTKLHPGEFSLRELMVPLFKNGKCVYQSPKTMEIRDYCLKEQDTLWEESRRLVNPHQVYVDLSQKLYDNKLALLDAITEQKMKMADE